MMCFAILAFLMNKQNWITQIHKTCTGQIIQLILNTVTFKCTCLVRLVQSMHACAYLCGFSFFANFVFTQSSNMLSTVILQGNATSCKRQARVELKKLHVSSFKSFFSITPHVPIVIQWTCGHNILETELIFTPRVILHLHAFVL